MPRVKTKASERAARQAAIMRAYEAEMRGGKGRYGINIRVLKRLRRSGHEWASQMTAECLRVMRHRINAQMRILDGDGT